MFASSRDLGITLSWGCRGLEVQWLGLCLQWSTTPAFKSSVKFWKMSRSGGLRLFMLRSVELDSGELVATVAIAVIEYSSLQCVAAVTAATTTMVVAATTRAAASPQFSAPPPLLPPHHHRRSRHRRHPHCNQHDANTATMVSSGNHSSTDLIAGAHQPQL